MEARVTHADGAAAYSDAAEPAPRGRVAADEAEGGRGEGGDTLGKGEATQPSERRPRHWFVAFLRSVPARIAASVPPGKTGAGHNSIRMLTLVRAQGSSRP